MRRCEEHRKIEFQTLLIEMNFCVRHFKNSKSILVEIYFRFKRVKTF